VGLGKGRRRKERCERKGEKDANYPFNFSFLYRVG